MTLERFSQVVLLILAVFGLLVLISVAVVEIYHDWRDSRRCRRLSDRGY